MKEPTSIEEKPEPKDWQPLGGNFKPLKARGIREETCEYYGYRLAEVENEIVQVCDVRNQHGELVGQKIRRKDKSFSIRGNINHSLIGMHLFTGGRKLIITEGEIDMLSWAQIQECKYPVVSIPSGVNSAKKAISHCLSYLESFDEILLAFDNDEPGRKAVDEVAMILMHKDVLVINHDLKDGNDMLLAGRSGDMIKAIWNAQPYQPAHIVTLEDVWQDVLQPVQIGLPWFSPALTELTYGRRKGEKYYFGAGAGIGKTDFFMRQIDFDANQLNKKVAVFMFETPVIEIYKRLAGVSVGQCFHKPNIDANGDRIEGAWTDEELEQALQGLRKNNNVYVFNSFGTSDWYRIVPVISYLVAQGVELFYLDHLTALATGTSKSEKETLETINAALAELCERHGCIFHVVSHLVAPETGKTHAEGGRVLPRQFKGSRSLEFWANFMFGLERNKFDEDLDVRNRLKLRVIKDRYTGEADGACVDFIFDHNHFSLKEAPADLSVDVSF